ncbi:hypothetical protein LSG31_17730 [Fodinisporobacter ferrooxydans]|uniref:Transporter n=1 Tax=Fodinisporobacter ferrooxydans TaxID=2901836 RepID=A0ABY4CGR6_9BACL|nr:hypothetical protein LSG31_17730 [Alicyclobacillaceae bacterium MYW30-H2]
MNRLSWKQSFQIGCTYIGTVIGAGFASGQEILQFFTIHGTYAYFGIFLATVLFAWGGIRLLRFGYELRAISYNQLTEYRFGKQLARILDSSMSIMLFGITVAMLAGVGALFQEQFHLSFHFGVLLTIGLTLFVLLKGMKGILSANSIIVPCMFLFTILIFILTLRQGIVSPSAIAEQENHWKWGLSSISYAAFNLGLAVSVLIPLGTQAGTIQTLKLGGLIGAVGLGVMMVIVHIALAAHMPGMIAFEVPMGYIAAKMNPWLQIGFSFVLWGEIFSSLIGNVYALSSQMKPGASMLQTLFLNICILTVAFFVAQIGFSKLVTILYPLFGYLSFFFILAILFPIRHRNE